MASLLRRGDSFSVQFMNTDKQRKTVSIGDIDEDEAELIRLHIKRMAAARKKKRRIPQGKEHPQKTRQIQSESERAAIALQSGGDDREQLIEAAIAALHRMTDAELRAFLKLR